ncbi:hypothetical protein F3Y22_tig00111779pilonHSYRG00083 [Hibiscus syriacus]|uniref:Rad21/Rec8-like protein N-terminal domain-containing protein n=1 Tax=Hibiscus syriacus TaxID=106335 RepID=A0A6A2Y8Y9_HIBSY|nr:hypothetical protein F3Y22_tig00111779pilonHSYRG00083 [Hibiscus syriacus]
MLVNLHGTMMFLKPSLHPNADHIMFPEVPIALRMSGHLLLGIVRIYSKKVEYLYHDCNIILIGLSKVFASSQVTPPEDAIQAAVQAITLPQTLDLDAMELDVDAYNEESIYIAQDIMMEDASPQEAFHRSGSIEMNDIVHEPPESGSKGMNDPAPDNQIQSPSFQDSGPINQMGVQREAEDFERQGPSNQTQVLESISNQSFQDFPEMETMRDAAHDFSTQNLPPGVDASPQLVIPPSPPPQQPRRKRRRNFFDKKLLLPNSLAKRALGDCSDIVRKRKKTPCSAFGVWKLNNARKAEQMFNEPSLTGTYCSLILLSFKSNIKDSRRTVPEVNTVAPNSVHPKPSGLLMLKRLDEPDSEIVQLVSSVQSCKSVRRVEDMYYYDHEHDHDHDHDLDLDLDHDHEPSHAEPRRDRRTAAAMREIPLVLYHSTRKWNVKP